MLLQCYTVLHCVTLCYTTHGILQRKLGHLRLHMLLSPPAFNFVQPFGGGKCRLLLNLSDLAVTRLGLHSRLWLLSICTLMATPFAILTLYLEPPHAFATLFAYYFFAETWFSLLFTVVVEIVPAAIRSGSVGTFLFLMNNVGGNLPMLVEPLTKVQGLGLHSTLYIMWPGLVAASGALFLVASFPLWRKSRVGETRPRKLSLD